MTVYLGGVISDDATCDNDILRKIGLAAGIVRNLDKIWRARNLAREVKVKILVQAVFLCNPKTWILREDYKRVVSF